MSGSSGGACGPRALQSGLEFIARNGLRALGVDHMEPGVEPGAAEGFGPVFIAFDVETSGPNPARNCVLSIGAAAYEELQLRQATPGVDQPDGPRRARVCGHRLLARFYANLLPPEGAEMDPSCLRDFWMQHPDRWADLQVGPVPSLIAIMQLADWMRALSDGGRRRLTPVAKPASSDAMFLHPLYTTLAPPGAPPMSFFAHCSESMLMALYHALSVDPRVLNAYLSRGLTCNHNAGQDALVQGFVYMQARRLIREIGECARGGGDIVALRERVAGYHSASAAPPSDPPSEADGEAGL